VEGIAGALLDTAGAVILLPEATMERPCLNDKDEHPDDQVLARHLGHAKAAWDSFTHLVAASFPSFSGEWRYYNDGKSWLYKLTRKKQTVCWVSVWPGAFKTTFYFGDKASDLITTSKLKKEYVDQFVDGKKYGKIRGVTVVVKKPADLRATKTLIEIKERLK
jgi:hypothetical protein